MTRTKPGGLLSLAMAAVFGLVLALPAAGLSGEPYWPSEVEQELYRVEREIVTTMRKLYTARARGQNDRVKNLSERFDELRRRQRRLRGLPDPQ